MMIDKITHVIEELGRLGLMDYIYIILLSSWAGLVKYLQSLKKAPFSWLNLFVELSTSGFVGLLAGLACQYYKLSFPATAFICGIAAHHGVRSLYLATDFLKNKYLGKGNDDGRN